MGSARLLFSILLVSLGVYTYAVHCPIADPDSAYPPTAPLQTHLLTPLHPLLTPLLHLTSALLLTYLSQHFRQLVRDRMVLSAEVMREYDRRFVYKRVFASKVDRSTQTEEAESIW